MNFLKCIIIGLCASIVAYFALFSLALVLVNMLPVIKIVAIGVGVGVMVHFMRKQDEKDDNDVQDPK